MNEDNEYTVLETRDELRAKNPGSGQNRNTGPTGLQQGRSFRSEMNPGPEPNPRPNL